MEVVEHVAALPHFLSHCTQLVKPEGILFIATINRNLLSWFVARFIEAPSARRMRTALNRALSDMRANSERVRG